MAALRWLLAKPDAARVAGLQPKTAEAPPSQRDARAELHPHDGSTCERCWKSW